MLAQVNGFGVLGASGRTPRYLNDVLSSNFNVSASMMKQIAAEEETASRRVPAYFLTLSPLGLFLINDGSSRVRFEDDNANARFTTLTGNTGASWQTAS
jgi:hypothetical protein